MKKSERRKLILRSYREEWLRKALEELRPHFEERGYHLPDVVKVFICEGKEMKMEGKTKVAFHDEADGFFTPEILYPDSGRVIAPKIEIHEWHQRAFEILGTLTHEMIHACVTEEEDHHGKEFCHAAFRMGILPEFSGDGCLAGLEEYLQPEFYRIADAVTTNLGGFPKMKHVVFEELEGGEKV